MASSSTTDQSASSTKRHRDKSYRHVFKGSVLINTLLDYDDNKFESRQKAIRFAQKLLDIGQIESIVGGDTFEDSVSLYRWCDESVLREARKINTTPSATTSAHIPKRRIIELIDLHQSDDTDDSYYLDRVINKLSERSSDPYDTNNNSQNRNVNNNNPEFRHHSADEYKHKSLDEDGHLTKGRRGHSQDDLCGAGYDGDPLAAWADNILENGDRFNEVDDFERQTSYEGDVFASNSGHHGDNQDISSSSIVTYDGIEMPAIDLENINFATMVGQLQSNTAQYSNMGELLDITTQEGSSFSDNEKQLLQQMRKMQEEHQSTVDGYEIKISELMDRISELKSLAELLETQQKETLKKKETIFTQSGGKDTTFTSETSTTNTQISQQPSTTPLSNQASPPPPPPVPPPPPPTLNAPSLSSSVVKPNKRPVKPRVKMRPLFWNRVILESENEETFWHYATEPNFDVDEFEWLFGRDPAKEKKPKKSLHETIAGNKQKDIIPLKQQKVKLLEENRSRAVAIKLRSMHCDLADIKNAVFKMDFSKLDVEKLYGLYEVKGSPEEMGMITQYMEDNPEATLDEPEAFLVEMSKMSQFSERIECLMFRKTLNESVFDIDQQLDIVQQACRAIRSNQSVRIVMELVLAFGNYMNGGTQRGQADGFDLEVLTKLKDVKSIDNSTTLLRHIVHVNTKENEAVDAGKNEASWKFPDAAIMTQASNISFKEVAKELNKLKSEIRSHSRKADIVCLNSKESILQPFKDQMDDFFDSADTMLKGQFEKLEATQDMYNDLLKYLAVKDNQGKIGTDTFFGIWAQLLDDYKNQWKVEQKEIAKQMFEKVETHRKERMRTAKRRKSIVEDGRSNLKQRFTLMRQKRSDGIANTVKLLRSQSMTGVDVVTSEETGDKISERPEKPEEMTRHESISGPSTENSVKDNPVRKHSRVRSRIREQNNATLRRSNSSASLQRNGESMIERMQQRRRSRVENEESQKTASNQSLNQTSSSRTRRTGVNDIGNGPSAQSQMSRIGARLSQQSDVNSITLPGTTDTIKERMQRRRREREAAAVVTTNKDTNVSSVSNDMSSVLTNPVKLTPAKSIDLSTLRSRFKDDAPLKQPVNAARQAMSRKSSTSSVSDIKDKHKQETDDHTNCDHPTCMAQRMTKAAVRANSYDGTSSDNVKSPVSRLHNTRTSSGDIRSVSSTPRQEDKGSTFRRRRDSLETSKTSLTAETESSRARRIAARDNWKGSQQSLPDGESSSRKPGTTRSRLGSKDGWRGSHQSLVEGSDGSPLVTRETRSSILRREAAARANQRLAQQSESRSPGSRTMRDLRTGLHSSQPSLLDVESKLSVSRRHSVDRDSDNRVSSQRGNRERRGSHQSDSSDNSSSIIGKNSSVIKRSRDTWKGSHQSLNSDNESSSTSTKLNTIRGRSTNKSMGNLRGGQSSVMSPEDKNTSRRSNLRQSLQGDNQSSENQSVSSITRRLTSLKISNAAKDTKSSSQSTNTSDIKGTVGGKSDQDALSEKNYRDVLRRVSRSRTNLVTSTK